MITNKVGIREFRADLAVLIADALPVAVTRHGQTVAYFIPVAVPTAGQLQALEQASQVLDPLLKAHGVDPEAVVAEFKQARKADAEAARATTP